MTMALHLMIPGLLEVGSSDHAGLEFSRPAAPALEWLLARADSHAVPTSTDATLFELFGLDASDDADLPIAAVTRLTDGGEPDTGWWLHADPVHLRADQQGVFLVDAYVLAVEADEAQALVAAFNQTFADDGLQLEALHPERWYLKLPADPDFRTPPLASVVGRDIRSSLPYGVAKQRWHTLLTEVQMLFYSHPVNQVREEKGLPLLNGIWFWGGGLCPNQAQLSVAGLYARDPLVRGLAQLADVAISPIPESAADWLDAAGDEPDSLVVLEHTRRDPADGDPDMWVEHVADLEKNWFAPCRQWLQSGKLTALHLYPGNGQRYTVTTAARWRFWQRNKSLSAYFA